MSYRELWVFIQHLPQESWTQTILRDESFDDLTNPAPAPDEQKFGPWALINYQIAALTDAVNHLRYVTQKASGHWSQVEQPEPTPRPGPKRPAALQTEAAVLYLDKLRARG